MTSTVKAELELLVDTIGEHASTLDDYLTEEVDELTNDLDRETVVQHSFNIALLRTIIAKMNEAKTTLQTLIDKN